MGAERGERGGRLGGGGEGGTSRILCPNYLCHSTPPESGSLQAQERFEMIRPG